MNVQVIVPRWHVYIRFKSMSRLWLREGFGVGGWRLRTTPEKSVMSATMLLSRPQIFSIGSCRCGKFASIFHGLKGLAGVLEVVVPQYAHEACDFQNHAALQALKSLQLATPEGHTPGALSRAGGQKVLKNR